MKEPLTAEEQRILLRLAREALEHGVRGMPPPALEPAALTPRLRAPGAAFVTLTIQGELRGCVGSLAAQQPLAEDVRAHAVDASIEDPRFPPVLPAELERIEIEVSCLSTPEKLEYTDAGDLLGRLRPGVDGVLLQDGFRRATYLPQVWEKIPEEAAFLDSLCQKMGLPPDSWRKKHLEVLVYQVQSFHE